MLPPIAKKIPYIYQVHGESHTDPYAWLRYQHDDPDVIAYLEAENIYTLDFMKPTEELQTTLFNEICQRMQLTDTSVPYFEKGFFYYWHTFEKQEYPVFCRRKDNMEAPEEFLLDENELAKSHAYFHMGECAISPNQRFLAFTEDICGNEEYNLCIKDLQQNEIITPPIGRITPHIVWANDNRTLFFTKLDDIWRPYQIWSYDLQTEELHLHYTEVDPMFRVHIDMSKDEKFIFIETANSVTTEVRFLSADNPTGEFECLYPREENVKYELFPHENDWYILTNQHAKNYQLIKVSMAQPQKENWQTLIGHRHEIKLEDLEIFQDFLVIKERFDAHVQLRIINLTTQEDSLLDFPEQAYSVEPINNVDFASHVLRVAYTSLTTPQTIYDIDLNTKAKQFLKQTPVLGDFDVTNYISERVHAQAADGTAIPISLVYHKDTPRNASTPLYLYGYGSYGISLNPRFSPARVSLLNRGIIYAIAHVRGGGDNGEFWYEDGKYLQKKNTFTDFITCAEHLIHLGYTSSSQLAISGGSAGGLLVGAVLNERPDLCAAAVTCAIC